ncbi:hypothetical protein ACFLVX_05560, partial [Chloroflexota bacterium]
QQARLWGLFYRHKRIQLAIIQFESPSGNSSWQSDLVCVAPGERHCFTNAGDDNLRFIRVIPLARQVRLLKWSCSPPLW